MLATPMNIKEIVDKIPRESQVNANDYPVSSRLDDVGAFYLELIELGVQIGSTVPISSAETNSENFTVVAGSNTFVRTIKDVPIQRVDFSYDDVLFFSICEDPRRLIGGMNYGEMRFFANEKQFFVEEGRAGTMRVTYARGGVTQVFTQANYDLGSAWPSPDFLPEVFHPLLWLKASIDKTKISENRTRLKERHDPLMQLFYNHYNRDAVQESQMVTEEDEQGNYR